MCRTEAICRKFTNATRWLLALALVIGTGQSLLATYSQDPAACSGTGGSVGISVFACTDGTAACSSPVAISGNGPVINTEWIAYQASFGPGAGKCAYALGTSGTVNLTMPDLTVVDLKADVGTCATGGGPVNCTLGQDLTVAATNGACIGCDGLETGGVETGASGNFSVQASGGYTGVKHSFHVSSASFVRFDGTAGACTPDGMLNPSSCVIVARTTFGGTAVISNDIAFSGASPTAGPELATPQANIALNCSSTVDKQVSCGTACTTNADCVTAEGGGVCSNSVCWHDVTKGTGADDTGGTSDLGCIAKVGTNVTFRILETNTGGASIACTLSDTPGSSGVVLPAGASAYSDTVGLNNVQTVSINPVACNLTGTQSGDNTATLGSCTCTTAEGAVITGTGGTDTATYACCGVSVDKQVSCGKTCTVDTDCAASGAVCASGKCFFDAGLETADGDGINGCSTTDGTAVAIRYDFRNTGNTALTCSGTSVVDAGVTLGLTDQYVNPSAACCTAADCNGAGICVGATAGCSLPSTNIGHCEPLGIASETDPGPGTTSGFSTNSNITTCSAALNTAESGGNKATINCTCNGTGSFGNNVAVTAFDVAKIQCAPLVPLPFTITKTCTPVAGVAGQFTADVTVNNLDTTRSISCQLTDQTVTGVCGTAPTCPISGGTAVTVSPNPLTVAASSSNDATGTISGLTVSACNQACGSCSSSTLTCATAADCPSATGESATCTAGLCVYTPTNAAQANCPIGFCFSRTPGYWGTHPQVTQTLLPLTVCGDTLVTTTAGVLNSATEGLCESGRDFKGSNTTPQQLQLIRQCVAAALNLAASGKGGGITGGEGACEGLDPGITTTFTNCCVGAGSTCDSGASGANIDASLCIGLLDAFNNSFEGTDFSQVGLTNSPADPTQCKVANGNGISLCSVSDGTVNCGTKK